MLAMVGELINLNDVTTLSPTSLKSHVQNQQTNIITNGSVAWSQVHYIFFSANTGRPDPRKCPAEKPKLKVQVKVRA